MNIRPDPFYDFLIQKIREIRKQRYGDRKISKEEYGQIQKEVFSNENQYKEEFKKYVKERGILG